MKIVNVIGGLGNQMFQYAFAISLHEKSGDDVYIDTSHYNYLFVKRFKSANLHNGFEIERVFPNAKLKHAHWYQLVRTTWYFPNYLLSRVMRKVLPVRKSEVIQKVTEYFEYNSEIYKIKGNVYFEGLWSSAKYYKPIKSLLKKVFAHPQATGINARYLYEMSMCNSVGIHVRRGDYLLEPAFRDICELDYYKRAINEIIADGEKHIFFVFSNDMDWCKEHLQPLIGLNAVYYVSNNVGNDSCWDMHLMRHCKDLIIANSSFSWWAAFLKEEEGRVIAPNKWVNRDAVFDVWDDNWIRL